jgi:hypothetical protein
VRNLVCQAEGGTWPRVNVNRIRRKICGPKTGKVTGNEESCVRKNTDLCLFCFVFLALQPIVVVFSQPVSGL